MWFNKRYDKILKTYPNSKNLRKFVFTNILQETVSLRNDFSKEEFIEELEIMYNVRLAIEEVEDLFNESIEQTNEERYRSTIGM